MFSLVLYVAVMDLNLFYCYHSIMLLFNVFKYFGFFFLYLFIFPYFSFQKSVIKVFSYSKLTKKIKDSGALSWPLFPPEFA